MLTDNTPWFYETIEVDNNLKVYKGDLFFAGMTKDDFIEYINLYPPEDRKELIDLRTEAGKRFTDLNISTTMATHFLLNIGTEAYNNGCREEWAIYAIKKVHKRGCGCFLLPVIVIIGVLYLIFR